jgi:hypothetical protein
LLAAKALLAMMPLAIAGVTPARADLVLRERDIGTLRLGQRVYVDDGVCPSGQIKLVTGSKLAVDGVQMTKQCVDRKGIKR